MRTNKSSLRAWIDLPSPWAAEPFIQAARTKGASLRHPRVFATPERNIRASLIAPTTHEDLRRELSVLADLLLNRT